MGLGLPSFPPILYNAPVLMLSILRNQKVQKKVYIVLAVALIGTFVLSGIFLGRDRGNPVSSVGRIGQKNITVQDYLASYKAIDHQARMIYGKAYDQIRPYINLKGEAWDRILLLQYAKKEGLKTSDKEVVDWISNQPYLQTQSGFDPRVYKMFVTEYLRTDSRLFEEEVRQTLTIQKIAGRIESRQKLSDADLRALYVQKKGERSIQYLVLSEPPAAAAEPSEDDLRKIYPMYQSLLTEPAKIRIRYVSIAKADADKMKEALADKTSTLDELSSKYGLKAAETPFFSRNEAIPGVGLFTEVIDAGFALAPGKQSDWIETADGFYKIRLAEKQAAKPLSFEEGRGQLKEILSKQKAVEASLEKLDGLSKDLKAADFEKFAADHKLEVRSSDNFKNGSYLPGIGPSGAVERELARVKEGEISAPVAVPGGAAIFKVLKNAPIDEKDFEKEKEALKKELARTKVDEEMDRILKGLRAELKPNLQVLKDIFPDDAAGGVPSR